MSFISPSIAHLFPDHGSPADRGRADAHYGRDLCPHKYVNNVRIELADGIDCLDFLNRLRMVISSSHLGDNRTLAIPVA